MVATLAGRAIELRSIGILLDQNAAVTGFTAANASLSQRTAPPKQRTASHSKRFSPDPISPGD